MCPECNDTGFIETVIPDFTWVREDEGFDSSRCVVDPCRCTKKIVALGWTPKATELAPSDEEPCPF